MIHIIESEWRETDRECPFCGFPLYSDGNSVACAAETCEFSTTCLTAHTADAGAPAGAEDSTERG
jgi:hypothetical protein